MYGLSNLETQQTRLLQDHKSSSQMIQYNFTPQSLVVNSPFKIYATDNTCKTNKFKCFAVSQS